MSQLVVIGSSDAPETALRQAEEVGRQAALQGWVLLTGGRGGIMAAASRGAAREGGTVIGVLPGTDPKEANEWVGIRICTGLGLARNVVLVSSADAVVALDGGSGTLSEIALAWQLGKPVIAVDTGTGWASRLAGTAIDGRRPGVVHRVGSGVEAVALAAGLVRGERFDP